MKKLILIRHGSYDYETGDLLPEGKEQMEKSFGHKVPRLTGKLGLSGVDFYFVSTDKPRARQSLGIAKGLLPIKAIAPPLGIGEGNMNGKNILVFLETHIEDEYGDGFVGSENIIFVCHQPNIEGLLYYFIQQEDFRASVHLRESISGRGHIQCGECILIDFEEKIIQQ